MPLERSFGSVPVCTEFNYKKNVLPTEWEEYLSALKKE
jgi:hypothetical protein